MPNVSSFGAQTDNAVVSGTVTDRQMIIPEVPPQGLMSVGPRVTPKFVQEPWSKANSYNFFDVVKDVAGSSYIAIKPVIPTNTELSDEEFWFKWSDPDAQITELQEIVKTYNERISQNASAITAEVARATAAEQAEEQRATAAEQAEEQRATAAEATKAPVNHASDETIYGIGNEVNYGHLKLAADDAPLTSGANDGVAATPKMIFNSQVLNKFQSGLLLNFGDSIAKGADATSPYYKLIASALGLNAIDFSINGAMVWESGDANTLSQVNNAIATVSEKENVKMILFEGGVNNTYNSNYAFPYTATFTCLNKLKQNFPHAKIICIPMLWSAYPFGGTLQSIKDLTDKQTYNTTSQNRVSCLNAMVNAANSLGVLCLDNAYQFGIGNRSWYTNFIHPNQTGHNRISEWILELFSGGAPKVFEKANIVIAAPEIKENNVYAQCIGSTITFGGSFKAKENVNKYLTEAFKLPTYAIIGTNPFMIPMYNFTQNKDVLAYTSGYNDYLETKIAINATNWNANDLIIVPPITYTIGSI